MTTQNITSVLKETRVFAPSEEFVKSAQVSAAEHARLTEWANRDPEGFWGHHAESLHWFRIWHSVFDGSNPPFFKWFVGGSINASYNCLDRHLTSATRNKAAIIWEG